MNSASQVGLICWTTKESQQVRREGRQTNSGFYCRWGASLGGSPPVSHAQLCLYLLSFSHCWFKMVALHLSWCLWQWLGCSSQPMKHCNSQCVQLPVDETQIYKVWLGNQGLLDSNQTGPVLASQRLLRPVVAWDEEAPLCPPTGKKICERWFNFTGHKVICPLPPLLLLVYYGGKLLSSPSIFCQQMEIVLSCTFLLPPSLFLLASLTSHSDLTWVLKSRLAIGSWKQSVGQTLGGILSRDLWGKKVWMGSHFGQKGLLSPSWAPKVCIYKQGFYAQYDKTTTTSSFNICYLFSPRDPVRRHVPQCLSCSQPPIPPSEGAFLYQVSNNLHNHGWFN